MVAGNITEIRQSSILCEAKNFSATSCYEHLDVPDTLHVGGDVGLQQYFYLIQIFGMFFLP
jgi:hypothetical protein